jgi:hypothetical protein
VWAASPQGRLRIAPAAAEDEVLRALDETQRETSYRFFNWAAPTAPWMDMTGTSAHLTTSAFLRPCEPALPTSSALLTPGPDRRRRLRRHRRRPSDPDPKIGDKPLDQPAVHNKIQGTVNGRRRRAPTRGLRPG